MLSVNPGFFHICLTISNWLPLSILICQATGSDIRRIGPIQSSLTWIHLFLHVISTCARVKTHVFIFLVGQWLSQLSINLETGCLYIYIYKNRCIITYKPLLWSSWPSPAIKSLDPRTILSVVFLTFLHLSRHSLLAWIGAAHDRKGSENQDQESTSNSCKAMTHSQMSCHNQNSNKNK